MGARKMVKRQIVRSQKKEERPKLQKMSVYGHLPDKNGVIQHFNIGDIIHGVKIPDLNSPKEYREVSILQYSDDYIARNGPALTVTNHNAPPTVRNQEYNYVILEKGNVPSVLANAIPRGKNAMVVRSMPGMEDYKACGNDVERLSMLCSVGGVSIGSIEILGHESRHSMNSFGMLPLNDEMLDIFTRVDVDNINAETVRNFEEMGYTRNQLFVNITGRDTSISVLAADQDQEKIFNVKLPSGSTRVSQVDEAYMSSVLCDAAHSAGISDYYESHVFENPKTGVAAQITEYAYSDMFIDKNGELKTSNSIPMFNLPLTDLLSDEDRRSPTYSAIADTFDRMMINSNEAKASLARSMLFNHAVHATGFTIGDIRCVVKSIDPDPKTGHHFEMVPLSFGLVPDPSSANSMQISLGNGFYNGQVSAHHDGMIPFGDQSACIDIVCKELGLSSEEARDVYNDVKSGIMSIPDHAAEHGLSKKQFNIIANSIALSFGDDFAVALKDDFDMRVDLASNQNIDQELEQKSTSDFSIKR